VTTIEEVKDLNTRVEDLISSLKCHEIGLNEHEPIKKPKSIALKSRGKSSKALKALESEEESTFEDSDEDSEIVKKMAMLSKKLQYLAKKNKRFLSRSSSHKSSRKEEKGCFNYKKTGHFNAECPNLQKDKSKDKSKKSIFKSNKFKKQIKKSLMSTWEDLDNESESNEEEAEDEAKIAMALVATYENEVESSDAESCTDSETETKVYSKLTRSELVESIKELLNLYENQSSELKKVKQHYIKLAKRKQKAEVLVPGQWLLATHDGR